MRRTCRPPHAPEHPRVLSRPQARSYRVVTVPRPLQRRHSRGRRGAAPRTWRCHGGARYAGGPQGRRPHRSQGRSHCECRRSQARHPLRAPTPRAPAPVSTTHCPGCARQHRPAGQLFSAPACARTRPYPVPDTALSPRPQARALRGTPCFGAVATRAPAQAAPSGLGVFVRKSPAGRAIATLRARHWDLSKISRSAAARVERLRGGAAQLARLTRDAAPTRLHVGATPSHITRRGFFLA